MSLWLTLAFSANIPVTKTSSTRNIPLSLDSNTWNGMKIKRRTANWLVTQDQDLFCVYCQARVQVQIWYRNDLPKLGFVSNSYRLKLVPNLVQLSLHQIWYTIHVPNLVRIRSTYNLVQCDCTKLGTLIGYQIGSIFCAPNLVHE